MVNRQDFPNEDEKNLDYGKSLRALQGEYLWDKAATDLTANLAKAATWQLLFR